MGEGDRKNTILEAGLKRFGQYGYRRTSMDDIAQAAGVSRPALYLHFRNKEDIFRSLVAGLFDDALARARAAFAAEGPFGERLRGAFVGWSVELMALVYSWPHAAELLDETSRSGADVARDAKVDFERELARFLRRAASAGEIDLHGVGLSAPRAAALLVRASSGLKDPEAGFDVYEERLASLARVFARAVGA